MVPVTAAPLGEVKAPTVAEETLLGMTSCRRMTKVPAGAEEMAVESWSTPTPVALALKFRKASAATNLLVLERVMERLIWPLLGALKLMVMAPLPSCWML